MCKTGRCIRKDLRCDGWADCPDYSDERHCRESHCRLPQTLHFLHHALSSLLPPTLVQWGSTFSFPGSVLSILADSNKAMGPWSHPCPQFPPAVLAPSSAHVIGNLGQQTSVCQLLVQSSSLFSR